MHIPRVGDIKSAELKKLYQISDVRFTEEGKMIVQSHLSNYPEVWETGLKGKQVRTIPSNSAGEMLLGAKGDETMPLSLLGEIGPTISPGMTLMNSSENIIGQTSITSGSIQLRYSAISKTNDGSATHGSDTVFKAATLPMWPAVNTTAASIAWPKSKDDLVRIVLDKTPQPWYDLEGPMDQHFPAVIDQDRRLWDQSRAQKDITKQIQHLDLPTTHIHEEHISQERSISIAETLGSAHQVVSNSTYGPHEQNETVSRRTAEPGTKSSPSHRPSGSTRFVRGIKKLFSSSS